MRKILASIISLALSLIVCLSTLSGCNLVQTDSKKDMNQVVATVQIAGDKAYIYKKDLIMSYMNKYYQYEQQGQSRAQVFDMMVSELIQSRVLVQSAILHFAGENATDWQAKTYLDDKERKEALYYTYRDINSLIDAYDGDREEDGLQDDYDGVVRVAPTGAFDDNGNLIKQPSEGEIDAYIQKGIDVSGRLKAYNALIKALKNNELLGDEYDGSNITTTEYYNDVLTLYYEKALVENYEQEIMAQARANVTYEKLQAKYKEIYDDQKELTPDKFAEKLEGVGLGADPIVYSKAENNGYGMVYHVLIKATADQETEITDWKQAEKDRTGKNPSQAQISAKRKEVFKNLRAYDKRTSWIFKGYDFDGQKFTGNFTMASDSLNSLAFKGDIKNLTPDKTEGKEYWAQAQKMTVAQFLNFMEEYLYGEEGNYVDGTDFSNHKVVKNTVENKQVFEQKIKELIFAFSDDDSDSALNTFKGYAITPIDADNTWADNFTTTGRDIVNGSVGEYGYAVVETDYGYHVMFLSEKFGESYNYQTLESYLDKEYVLDTAKYADWEAYFDAMLLGWDDWKDTENYLYVLVDQMSQTIVENAVSKNTNDLINKYIRGEGYVVRNDSVYADLLG